jgi:hypothetical protein
LREEPRLRVFENWVMRRIFGSKWDETVGEQIKPYNDLLNELYSSPNIVRVIKLRRVRLARNVERTWGKRGVFRALFGKHEGKRPLVRPRCTWENNIKMDLQEVGCGE